MNDIHLSIRVDCASGFRIGPGKIALLEAIRSAGSITAAAKSIGMSYRRAWLLVDEINHALREPVVATKQGGSEGGGTTLTAIGEQIIRLYTRSNYMLARTCVQNVAQSENCSARSNGPPLV